MKTPPVDWEYLGKWAPDKHANNGDKSGWVYSMSEEFWGESGTVDTEARPGHRYRRRCIARTRQLKNHDKNNENFNLFEKTLGDAKWEVRAFIPPFLSFLPQNWLVVPLQFWCARRCHSGQLASFYGCGRVESWVTPWTRKLLF